MVVGLDKHDMSSDVQINYNYTKLLVSISMQLNLSTVVAPKVSRRVVSVMLDIGQVMKLYLHFLSK